MTSLTGPHGSAAAATAAVEKALRTSAFHSWLGIELVHATDGAVTLHQPIRSDHLVDGTPSYMHGGIIAAVADLAGDMAFVTRTGIGVPTIDIRIDYLRPARSDTDLDVAAQIIRSGRRFGVADVQIHDSGRRLIAIARGLYALGSLSP